MTGLSALFQLPPERAIAYLQAKGDRLTWNWWEMQGEAHARAFTVAKVARLDILQDIRAAVEKALAEGKTEHWFRQELEHTLRKKGWWGKQVDVDPTTGEAQLYQAGSRRRLQTIYRTNLQTAYMAGRQRQFDAERDRAPFVQYLAVRDSRTRPAHAALHAKVFRLDDPAWDLIAPPNGFNCRCRARNLSQRELDARGLTVATDTQIHSRAPEGERPVDPRTGETPERWLQRGVSIPDPARKGDRLYLWPDVGWDYNPGRAGIADIAVKKLAEAPAELAKPVIQSLVADLLERWLANPRGVFPLALIAGADAELIGARTRVALLSEETAAKQRVHHPELTAGEYAQAQACVDRGERIQDGARNLIYLLESEGYVTVVKATKSGEGLWVTSFRRLSNNEAKRDSEIRRLRRKGS